MQTRWIYVLYSLRPKQWIKNVFVLMPLLFGKKLFVWPENFKALLATFLFCLASSAIYLLNDLLDVEADRAHAAKRLRPIASGRVSTGLAKTLSFGLAAAAAAGAFFLSAPFGIVIVVYLLMNVLYSLRLKRIVIIDVFCIALFFLLRIIGGTFVVDVRFSHWMVFMVALLAMFLAFNKRRQDIRFLDRSGIASDSVHFKYNRYFIDQMISTLTSSLVVVYMLYTVDARTIRAFGSNHLVYTTPFVYYGIFRYLYLVHRRKLGEDPTLLVYKDVMMKLNLVFWTLACVLIIYFKI